MAVPLAGQIVRASDVPVHLYIKKSASESVTSSTVMQNDDDFTATLDADSVYRVEVFLAVSGATGGDIKVAWVVTGGVAQLTTRNCIGPAASTTDATDTNVRASRHNLSTATISYGVDGSSATMVTESFLVETTTAGTTGTLTMQWAQNASSATATTVSTQSFMVLTKLEAA